MASPLVDAERRTLISTNPAEPGQTVATVPLTTSAELDDMVAAAEEAQRRWAASGLARSEALVAFSESSPRGPNSW